MLDITASHPLGRWVVGRLKFHFDGGAVVEHRVPLDEARRVRKVAAQQEESDGLAWHSLRWLQWDNSRLVFSSFDVAEDAGWSMTAEERTALEKAGHPHGIVRSLVEFWADQETEPRYSALAMHELHQAAVSGMSRTKWDRLARLAQGDKGNERLLDALIADAERPASSAMNVDDDAQPEPTAEPAQQSGPDTAVANGVDDAAEPSESDPDGTSEA